MPRIDLYNTYQSSTALLQYLGSSGDVVTISVIAVLSTVALNDLGLGTLRSQSLNPLRDASLNGLLTSVAMVQPIIQHADTNGVCNWLLWTNGLPAGTTLVATAEVIQ
jgi:hypothetical protein